MHLCGFTRRVRALSEKPRPTAGTVHTRAAQQKHYNKPPCAAETRLSSISCENIEADKCTVKTKRNQGQGKG